jgi:hypothetical protein
MRARASAFLTRRSSSGETINVTKCHESGPPLLPSTFPAHPHPPLLLLLLAPNPSAAFRPSNLLRSSFEEERMGAQGRLDGANIDGAYTACIT